MIEICLERDLADAGARWIAPSSATSSGESVMAEECKGEMDGYEGEY